MTNRGRVRRPWWLLSLPLLAAGPQLNAATFTVRNTNDKGKGSLRYAIEQVNARAGSHSIVFDFDGAGPFRIQPVSPLPDVVRPVFIDATRLPGFAGTPIVELDGSRAGPGAHGLELRGGHSEVRGLAIHHFDGAGLYLAGGVSNVVAGCFLGGGPSGALSGGNEFGLLVGQDSTHNTIGGLAVLDANSLSGNRTAGLALMGTGTTGNVVEGNRIGANGIGVLIQQSPTNTIGGVLPGARNVISANGDAGILILGPAPGNVIQGNFIGIDPTGTRPLGNGGSGIVISNAVRATVGGSQAPARNVISGNQFFGLDLSGESHVVQGNYVGTDAAGLAPVPNGSAAAATGGLRVAGAYHTIGGPEMESGNLVSGNRGAGLVLRQAAYCAVQCNWIGPDRTGVRALPGQSDGVVLIDSLFNTIGGAGTVEGNLISGNENHGLVLRGESQRNVIQRNWVGLNLAGLASLPNGGSGVVLGEAAAGNLLGGVSQVGNIVSGNAAHGVEILAPGTVLRDNWIGTDLTGFRPAPNGGHGVVIRSGTNRVAYNRIAYNGGNGILVLAGRANRLTTNSIWAHPLLGVDLLAAGESAGTTTSNDSLDSDTGPNGLQNHPTLTDVSLRTGSVRITGELNSRPLQTYQIELHRNSRSEPLSFEEGQSFLRALQVTTDAGGRATFSFSLPGSMRFEYFTALALDLATGDTSEFSPERRDPVAPPDLFVSDAIVTEAGGTAEFEVRLSGPSALVVEAGYTTLDGTATAPADYQPVSGRLTFAPGETRRTITVPLVADTAPEADERFYLIVRNAQNALLVDNEGVAVVTEAEDASAVPVITSIRTVDAGVEIRFTTAAGRIYRLESRPLRTQMDWQPVPGLEAVTGTGRIAAVIDPAAAGASRLYRIGLVP